MPALERSEVKIANLIRVLIRAPIALLWTEALHAFLLLRKYLIRGRWKHHRAIDVIGFWGKGLAWIMGVRIKRLNRRDWPMGDVIISNHMGFLDIPLILDSFPAVFIIHAEALRMWHFGTALRQQGHVFVKRSSTESRRSARDGLRQVLEEGDRIIVFPEGGASSGAKRPPFKPFCFFEAKRQGKRIEACVIDYLPDRNRMKWDLKRKMFPQLVELIGRHRTYVSIEYLPSEIPEDPEEAAARYHDLVEQKLAQYDREREEGEA